MYVPAYFVADSNPQVSVPSFHHRMRKPSNFFPPLLSCFFLRFGYAFPVSKAMYQHKRLNPINVGMMRKSVMTGDGSALTDSKAMGVRIGLRNSASPIVDVNDGG